MPHRVGGIPFIIENGVVKVLLVTSVTRGRWVFPKGLLKKREGHLKGCRREALEEAGVKGTVLRNFPITALIKSKDHAKDSRFVVTFYPLLVTRQLEKWPERHFRKRQWVRLDEIGEYMDKADLRKVAKMFKKLLPYIKNGLVKSKRKVG